MTVTSTHHGLSVYAGTDDDIGADTADIRCLRTTNTAGVSDWISSTFTTAPELPPDRRSDWPEAA